MNYLKKKASAKSLYDTPDPVSVADYMNSTAPAEKKKKCSGSTGNKITN